MAVECAFRGFANLRSFELNADELRELMQFISKSNFVEFEMEQDGFKLRLIKADSQVAAASGRVEPTSAAEAAAIAAAPPAAAPVESATEDRKVHDVLSPIVGTYYRAPSPDAPPYVQVGDRVKMGQVLCIVEAMKLMNEIEADVAGEILEVLPTNGQPVEFGEVLFRVLPLES
jgi:acetyl-CoA carboxylase biotin carboxyl carrier protein